MKREDVINKLDNLKIDDYILLNDTSLVIQEILDTIDKIEIYTKEKIDDENFLVSNTKPRDIVLIDKYKCMSLESCFNYKKTNNLKQDKKIIEKLDILLCSKDNRRYEKELNKKNIKIIAGVDEVGRGPLVGPVVACCCVLNDDFKLDGLTDSKKLSEKKRDEYFSYITSNSTYALGIVDASVIDEVNIYEATKIAMKKAIDEVNKKIKIEHVLIDAMPLELDIESTSIIKGDFKSISIAAASVIAKVTRDKMMYELDLKHPEYGYASHKGYPTKKHIDALNKYGLIEGYRKTYGPVKDLIEKGECKWK